MSDLPPLTFRMSLPVNSRLDFGRGLTFVRFVAADVFFAMVSSPFGLVLQLPSVGITPKARVSSGGHCTTCDDSVNHKILTIRAGSLVSDGNSSPRLRRSSGTRVALGHHVCSAGV